MHALSLLGAALLALSTAACASPGPAPSPTVPVADLDATSAWVELQHGLPGTWTATTPSGRSLEVSYRIVSRNSALLETFGTAPAEQTLTVYHPDGRSLRLTHYCAQGNQARLRATAASPGHVVFHAVDATNVTPDQSVLHELEFELGPDTLQRTERYRAHDGTLETSVLRFVRRPSP